MLTQGFGGKSFKVELLMRGSAHGFSANAFHELCDGKGPTLSIIESEQGKVFGGFTTVAWMSYDCRYFPDAPAFLFSLSNRSIHRQHRYKNYAVSHDKSQLMVFGRGNDLCIYDNCNVRKDSFCSLGDTYEAPPGMQFESFEAKSYLPGACLFKVRDFEVFQVIFN